MLIFPAVDLYEGKAVRLVKGDYNRMTVYNYNPLEVALDFKKCGAEHIHLVDLEGAKIGKTPNFDIIKDIKNKSGLFCEVGGGISSKETAAKYIEAGIDRIILGTAAFEDETLLVDLLKSYGEKIAVGIDIKDGYIAIKGWTEKTDISAYDFFEKATSLNIRTVICTDISKDGLMNGINHNLYSDLSKKFRMNIIASGGVSSIADIKALKSIGLYGAIIGKAYYIGAVNLKEAIEVSKC